MKYSKAVCLLLLLMLSATLSLTPMVRPATAAIPSTVGPLEGPYFKEIRFKIYANTVAETEGLVAGDIDVVDFFEASQIPSIQPGLDSGKLKTIQAAEQGMWGFAFQCQRYPLNITDFRRAIAHLCDKDLYVSEGLQGLGYKIETYFGSPGYGPWAGTNYMTYDFSPTKAEQILDSLGFVMGPDGKRIDPKTGTTMRPLDILARTEMSHRIFSAEQLAAQMKAVGIPYKLEEVPRSVASPRVMLSGDYDIYTAGWGGGPDVDWAYDNFYSTQPEQMNIFLFKNSTVDAALYKEKFGSSREEVLQGTQEAQRLLSEQIPFIPLYAQAYISPYNARLKQVVNLPWWSGATNWMTFLYAYGTDQNDTLNVGWTSDPQQPSPMFQINWWWDTMLVSTVYDYLINPDPNTFTELPWLAKSWTVESWTAPGNIPGLKITFNLVNNATWHDGLALTADDVVFTWKYAQQYENPVYISYLTNLVDANATDQYTAVAYLNTTSYWALHWLGWDIPIIPKHVWEKITDPNSYQPITEGNLIGSGPYRFKVYKPGEYVILEANPNYFLKPKGSTLGYTPLTLTQGESRTFSRSAVYLETPITNGTYTLTLTSTSGAILKTVNGTVAANGNYSVTLDTTSIQPGTYLLIEKLAVPVFTSQITGTPVGLGALEDYQLTVEAQPTTTTPPPPPNYTLYVGALVAIVVIIAAGYVVLRRRGKPT